MHRSAVAPRARLSLWPLAALVLAGQVMATLDGAIVNVAAPRIQADLHLSAAALELTIYAYVLVFAVTLILGARLGDRLGFGRLFTLGVTIFTLSSLACGAALTPAELVAARVVQGFGAALLVPQVLSLLQITFEGHARRRALSLYGMVLALGVACGQVVGGLLLSANVLGTGWRPIFLVNVPIGVAIVAVAASRLPENPQRTATRLDVAGAGFLALGILGLVVPVTFGADAGWPAWCWPVLLAGLMTIVAFVSYERRLTGLGRQPILDTDLLGQPAVRRGLLGIFTLMGCYGSLLFTIALYLQASLQQSALRSGLTFAAYAVGFATASLTWTKLPASVHERVPVAAFVGIAAVACGLAWATGGGGWPPLATGLLVLAGVGHGAGFEAILHDAADGLPTSHAASLSGIVSTTTQLAVVVGIAAAGTAFFHASGWTSYSAMSVVLAGVALAEVVTGAAFTVALILGRNHARQTRAKSAVPGDMPPRILT